MIVAGEASGDVYGAHLVSAFKKRYPEVRFSGVGGARMEAAGVEILFGIDDLAIIGFFEIFSKLNVIKDLFGTLTRKIDEEKFDLAILVNYPGFNLRFAGQLKKRGIPVVFYSSPQVWAWGKWRLRAIRKLVDKMVVFFKFERDFYKAHGVEAEFVGHPLVDIVKPCGGDLGIEKDAGRKIISLVPGSRKSEVSGLFGTMLDAAKIIYSRMNNVLFLVTKHPDLPPKLYQRVLDDRSLPLKLIDGKTYDCLARSDLAITVSGSVTLEAAILKTPMIIINRLSLLTGLLYLAFVRLENVGLVNIVMGRRIMPELLQYSANARNIAREVLKITSDDKTYKRMKEDLEEAGVLVGPPGASDRAVSVMSGFLK